jgi:hypothetical protein
MGVNVTDEKSVSHEELIKLEPVSEAFCAANQVKVGTKKIIFKAKYDLEISFERGVAHTRSPDFMVCVHEAVPVYTTCSMGHRHETGRSERKWGRIQLSWEHAEQLLEWFREGTWPEVREKNAKKRARIKELLK